MYHEVLWHKNRSKLLESGIMVDVESAGPSPSLYPLLSLGASVIGQPQKRFYVELKPDKWNFKKEAMKITNLSLETLALNGTPPKEALELFHAWVLSLGIKKPLFVAHNASYDWMFYADYAACYETENPFGYFAFDTLSAFGSIMTTKLPHHAGEDAYLQTLDLRAFFQTY